MQQKRNAAYKSDNPGQERFQQKHKLFVSQDRKQIETEPSDAYKSNNPELQKMQN